MIRLNSDPAKAMEFTRFRKRDNITDDELLFAVLKFETVLAQQKGVIFHCLVRNYENEYLGVFENIQAHCIGALGESKFSEVTFGKTLAKTKQICFGYFENPHGLKLLNLADKESMELDFWYLIA